MAELVPTSWKNNLAQLREGVNRAFDRWLSKWRRRDAVDQEMFFWPSIFTSGGPAIDIGETDAHVLVTAELPGLDKNDFKVEVTENRLVIRGDKKQSYAKEDRSHFYAERSYGSFARAITLPCEIDPAKAEAKFKNGLLRLTLPKSDQAKSKRIKVQG